MKLNSMVGAMALGAAAVGAMAEPVSGSTAGTWVNPNPSGAAIVTTGVGTSSFTWGDSSGRFAGDNSLSFVGGVFASVTESPFKIGTIEYHNGTTALGSTPDTVDLALALNFISPALGSVVSNYTFNLATTANGGVDPDADADYVYLPSAFSTTSFLIGGTVYNVKLAGFENIVGDGYLSSNALELHVREGLSASADLYAVVTTQINPVPEPETYALMLAGLVAMGAVVRRRSAR